MNLLENKSSEKSTEYSIIKTTIHDIDNGQYEAYGISARLPGGEETLRLEDISSDFGVVDNFIDMCNKHGASLINFHDILYEYLISL